MKRIISSALALGLVAITLPLQVEGRDHRPAQIPNGTVNNCQNCHMSVFGGDARNPFGLIVEADFLTSVSFLGDVVWGPELAAIDADGDGFTNGEELGDPEGTWAIGDPDPEVDEVFFPGDPESHPPEPEPVPTAVEESSWGSLKTLISKFLH